MIKRLIIAIILLAIVVGGIVGFNIFRDRAIEQFFATMPRPQSAVSTVKAEPVRWTPDIQAIGTVSASRGVDLVMEVPGIVREMPFKANDRVEQGDLLVHLNDTVEAAALGAQNAQAAFNEQNLNRAIELQSRGVGSNQTLDEARAAATAAKSEVERLQAVLDQKILNAPFSGTIGIPRVEVGQYVASGTVIATLQNLDTLRADFSVPEQNLDLLKIGQAVKFGITAEDMSFTGKVTGIEPKVDPATRLVLVRAEIENPDGKLSPGQFVRVAVQLPQEDNILALPQTAVVPSLYGDYVYVVAPGQPAPPAPENPEPLESGETVKSTVEPQGGDAAQPAEAVKQNPSAEGEPNAPKPDQPQSDQPTAAGAPAEPAAAPAAPAEGQQLVASQVFVKTGRRTGGLIEIVEGIKPGDEIVTAGQNRLSNGAPVKVDNSVTPGPATLPQTATSQ